MNTDTSAQNGLHTYTENKINTNDFLIKSLPKQIFANFAMGITSKRNPYG